MSVVAIFFAFGVAGVALTALWIAHVVAQNDRAMKAGELIDGSLFGRVLASPSTFFAPMMLLAGIACHKLNLLGRETAFSVWRVLGGTTAALPIYHLGLATLLALALGVGDLAQAIGFGQQAPQSHLGEIVVFLYAGTILCATGMITVMLAALAFRLTTRFRPRRVLRWSLAVSATAILSSIVASAIRESIRFPGSTIADFTSSTDHLFFSLAWNVELPILIGEPLLAALLGHWLYQAAKEYSFPPAV